MISELTPIRPLLPESLNVSRSESPFRDKSVSRFRIKSELRGATKMPPLALSQPNTSINLNKNSLFPPSKTPLRRPQGSKTERPIHHFEPDPASEYFSKPPKFLGVDISASSKNVDFLHQAEPSNHNSQIMDESIMQMLNSFTARQGQQGRLTPLASSFFARKGPSGLKDKETAKRSMNLKANLLAFQRRTNNASDPLTLREERIERPMQNENNVINPPAFPSSLDSANKGGSKNGNVIKAYAANTNQGLVRNYNEDRVSIILHILKPANIRYEGEWPNCSFFGIYDGHGGYQCADFLRDNLHQFVIKDENFPFNPVEALRNGFREAESKFTEYAENQSELNKSGSCAIVALIINDICYIANVGDSRAVLSSDQGTKITPMSQDHKPNEESERQRIVAKGGRIYQSHFSQPLKAASMLKNSGYAKTIFGPHRVFPGRLSVSRTFGDIEAKLEKYGGIPGVITAEPDIIAYRLIDDDDFIVLGCDGIFDKLSNEEVIKSIWVSTKVRCRDLHHQSSVAVGNLLSDAMAKKTLDNVTAVLISLEGFRKGALIASENADQPSKNTIFPEKIASEMYHSGSEGRLRPLIPYHMLKKPGDVESERTSQDRFENISPEPSHRRVEVGPMMLPPNLRRELQKGEVNQSLEDYGTLEFITRRPIEAAYRARSRRQDRISG